MRLRPRRRAACAGAARGLRAAERPGRAEPTATRLPRRRGWGGAQGEARKELDVACKLIAECDDHRRDEELAELDAVTAGDRRSPTCRLASEAAAPAIASICRPGRAGASDLANPGPWVEASFRSLRAANRLDKNQKYVLCTLTGGISSPASPGRADKGKPWLFETLAHNLTGEEDEGAIFFIFSARNSLKTRNSEK